MATGQTERGSPGALLVIVAAVLWGTTGTSQALAPAAASPLAIGALRIIVGGVVLLGLALLGGGFRGGGRWPLRVTALAILTTASYQLTFFGGVYLTGVAVGTVIAIGSAPAWSGLLGALFNGERLTPAWVGATVLAVIGGGLLVTIASDEMRVHLGGVGLALGAGLSYATFTLVNKRLLAGHPSDEVMAVSFCGGALLLAPLLWWVPVGWVLAPNGLAVVLHLGVLATGASYAFFGRGLRSVSVAAAGTLSLAEPLTAALLGVLFLQEPVTLVGGLGMLLVLAGLGVVAGGRAN